MKYLAIVLLLAGCESMPYVPYVTKEPIPAYLKSCPAPPQIPSPPPKPRTIDSIADWGTNEETVLRVVIQDYWECDGERAQLLKRLEEK